MTTQSPASLPKTYDPHAVEASIYEMWERNGYFQPSEDPEAAPFSITIPPPNVTGELHYGHALTYSIEDVLGRYKRMAGFSTLILPGTDHASIAVHAKVEALLASEGVRRRFEIGPERFLERAWAWKERYAGFISHQFRALGEGYDWSRERFTMDPAYVRSVLTMFVQLYDEGYIYRGSRVINWCPDCQTGVSDIEVRQEQRTDPLYVVRLPFVDGSGGIEVATVRPETMFGDVAVAVHPEDERYRRVVGQMVRHPLTNEEIPVISDSFVDPTFGTGAVKITPAHDYADFEVGERHGLPMPVVITPGATMSASTGEYAGLSATEAREQAVAELTQGGYLVRQEPLEHSVPLCDRSGTVIEPMLSEQWFMRMDELARPAIKAVRDGRVRFVPDRWARVYLDWMENIRPWNISRQLWWGHRIPIYYCRDDHVTASVEPVKSCPKCGSTEIVQDPDVLDTWFSSAIWPFATLGWPDETADLRRFYPTSFMNTSSQILYLWIARMIMMGIHFMGEVPFPVVLINPTILNEKGQRMSKSLGTGIDPLEIVGQYGADAARFGVFTAGSIIQQEIRISGYERADEGRKFANKVWNVSRFLLQSLSSAASEAGEQPLSLSLPDRWILSRLSIVRDQVTADMESFDLTSGLRKLYDFFWSEFADWYVEFSKTELRSDQPAEVSTARAVLWSVLDRALRLLHPYMPFITEEIWQRLRLDPPSHALELSELSQPLPPSIMVAPWPGEGPRDETVEDSMGRVMEVVRAIRNLRAEHGVKPQARLTAELSTSSSESRLTQTAGVIRDLAGLSNLTISKIPGESSEDVAEAIAGDVTVRIPLSQLTDVGEEIARMSREIDAAEGAAARAEQLLGNPSFVERAPAHVVDAERQRLERSRTTIEQLRRHMERLRPET